MRNLPAIITALAFIAAFLLFYAKAVWANDPLVLGYPTSFNAVFSCKPGNFTLRRTADGYSLSGLLETPGPGYGYDVSPIDSGVTGRNARSTLTVKKVRDLPETGAPSTLGVRDNLGGGSGIPISRLTVDVVKDFPAGADKIDCIQIGGSQ